eukprot:3635335-Rhodomonas_salina.1
MQPHTQSLTQGRRPPAFSSKRGAPTPRICNRESPISRAPRTHSVLGTPRTHSVLGGSPPPHPQRTQRLSPLHPQRTRGLRPPHQHQQLPRTYSASTSDQREEEKGMDGAHVERGREGKGWREGWLRESKKRKGMRRARREGEKGSDGGTWSQNAVRS